MQRFCFHQCSVGPESRLSRSRKGTPILLAFAMCFGGRKKEDEEGAARSRELDKVIRADEKRLQREVKLLLLGTHKQYPHSCVSSPAVCTSPLGTPAAN